MKRKDFLKTGALTMKSIVYTGIRFPPTSSGSRRPPGPFPGPTRSWSESGPRASILGISWPELQGCHAPGILHALPVLADREGQLRLEQAPDPDSGRRSGPETSTRSAGRSSASSPGDQVFGFTGQRLRRQRRVPVFWPRVLRWPIIARQRDHGGGRRHPLWGPDGPGPFCAGRTSSRGRGS